MSEFRFTYDWYEQFVRSLCHRGFEFCNFAELPATSATILRHDVDWSPRKAVELAEIEAENNIHSTFFFLLTTPFYNAFNEVNRRRIEKISELGHTIGLHFDPQQYWNEEPSRSRVVEEINSEIEIFERLVGSDARVVSFHNPPEWILNNTYSDFTNAYEPRFFEDIAYYADSNQRWRESNPFNDELDEKMQLLTHPIWWGEFDGTSVDRFREAREHHIDEIERRLSLNPRWRNR